MVCQRLPFLDVMWTMLVFLLWVAWFWVLRVWATSFAARPVWSRQDRLVHLHAGIAVPRVFIYVISQNDGMNQRNLERARRSASRWRLCPHNRGSGGGAAADGEKAKQLLDSGATTRSSSRPQAKGAGVAATRGPSVRHLGFRRACARQWAAVAPSWLVPVSVMVSGRPVRRSRRGTGRREAKPGIAGHGVGERVMTGVSGPSADAGARLARVRGSTEGASACRGQL